MAGALWTDLYELNMAASYMRRGMNDVATFALSVRSLPPHYGFLVAAGLEPALEFLEGLRFSDEDLRYCSDELGFGPADVRAFERLRFEGDVRAIPEGTIALVGEPLLEVSAPIPVGQLVETALLNIVTMHTSFASAAARFQLAAGDRAVVDFAFRRAHGIEAAIAVARTSAMVGFASTSNVEAARILGLTASGTMAHSYVEAFPDEREAFRAFAQDFPGRTTFLVDTYDTPNGVRTAVDVIRQLGLRGPLGVRIDSGDLDEVSRDARAILDDADLRDVRIFASGGLDEHAIESLVAGGAPIDAFGVGTQLANAPTLESVYKLVRYGDRPALKLSAGKATLPGEKQVFRTRDGDSLGLRDEAEPARSSPLLADVMRAGRRVDAPNGLGAARQRFDAGLGWLPGAARRLIDPTVPEPRVTDALAGLRDRSTADALAHLGLRGR